ncbi:GNAT family N-acetyltransferase [Flavobacterium sp. GCM10027622]|uniref:GNAT family N-acetyltransferase n=1 Tax=unclassified Flavobacterium TaxID=196869 RepID=UPI00360EAE8D
MIPRNFQPFPVLSTERLTLRALHLDDVQALFQLRSDAEINRYLDRQPSKSLQDVTDFIRKISEGIQNNQYIYWVITLTDSGTFVGTICLFSFSENSNECEIGFELSQPYQKKGIMKEAANAIINYVFTTLKGPKINAFTHKENQSSIQLLEALHFKIQQEAIEDHPNLLQFALQNPNHL